MRFSFLVAALLLIRSPIMAEDMSPQAKPQKPGRAGLTPEQAAAQSREYDALIAAAYADPAKKPDLAKALMRGRVVAILIWDNPQSTTFRTQDFIKDGKSYIPIWSDKEHFQREMTAPRFSKHGVFIDTNALVLALAPKTVLVLNAASGRPISFMAEELRAFVDRSRFQKPKPKSRPDRLRSRDL